MTDEVIAPRGRGCGNKSLLVRRATRADVNRVAAITVRAYVEHGFIDADDDYVEQLRDAAGRLSKAELWVAEIKGVLVGAVAFCPPGSTYRELAAEGEGEFRMLAVDPASRGQGVARALVQRCLDRCSELGLADLVLCSMQEMSPAHALYTSMGFVRDPALDWKVDSDVTLIGFRITA
jgi:GNAT superfamily N-acetyltransferase